MPVVGKSFLQTPLTSILSPWRFSLPAYRDLGSPDSASCCGPGYLPVAPSRLQSRGAWGAGDEGSVHTPAPAQGIHSCTSTCPRVAGLGWPDAPSCVLWSADKFWSLGSPSPTLPAKGSPPTGSGNGSVQWSRDNRLPPPSEKLFPSLPPAVLAHLLSFIEQGWNTAVCSPEGSRTPPSRGSILVGRAWEPWVTMLPSCPFSPAATPPHPTPA